MCGTLVSGYGCVILGFVLLGGSNCCEAGLKKTKRISVRYHLFTMC